MSYTVAKLHGTLDPIHRYTGSLKPYLAKQYSPKVKKKLREKREAAEGEVILCTQGLLNSKADNEWNI